MRVPWAPSWILFLLVPLLACRPSGSAAGGSGSGGLATTFDSTADTVLARVRGAVPEASVRTLVEEMRIAPGVEDTTLFTEVSEFDFDRSGTLYLKRPVSPPREGEFLGRMGLVGLGVAGAFGDSLAPPDLPIPREVYYAERVQGGGRARSSTSSRFAPGYIWAWHPEGFFVVGHGGNYEIVLARSGAKPLAITRELPNVPISEEERGEERERILFTMRLTDPSWSWSGPPIPESKAPLRNLFMARDGRIWAEVPVPSERIPEPELTIPRDKRQPIAHFRTPLVYEVYASDGHFLGRVSFPRRTRLMEADGDAVWALGRDQNDLPAVIRFRIQPALR